MTDRVLVPWPLTDPPASIEVSVWDGGDPPEGDLGDVSYYVLPYPGPKGVVILDRLTGLKAAQVLSAGYEHVLPHLKPDVRLFNGRGLHDASTAEHALALILAAQRDLPRWFEAQRDEDWQQDFTDSLADRRVLVVGAGSIGQAIVDRLAPFEAEVTVVASRARDGVHGVDELPALLPQAEIVVLILPATPGTAGLIGKRELDLLPDGALLVNVGRGSAVDTDALVAQGGRIRAALDVVDPEPLPAGHPLWHAPGVLLTPHVAGGSASFPPRAHRFVEAQVRRWAAGEPLENEIDR